jgi:hypothetical protein
MFFQLVGESFLFISYIIIYLASVVTRIEALAETLFIISEIIELIALVVFMAIFASFEENKSFSPRVSGFALLVALTIGSLLATGFAGLDATPLVTKLGLTYIVQLLHDDFTALLLLVLAVFTYLWIFIAFVRTMHETKNRAQRHLLTWPFGGIFLSQIGGVFGPVSTNSQATKFSLDIIIGPGLMGIVRIFGICMIGVAFLRVAKYPWLLQLQKMHLLLVYSRNGLALYSKIFRQDIDDQDVQLLAGAISAVAQLFKESTKTTAPIEAINFRGKVVRFIDRGDFVSATMVDFSSQASEMAHENFTKEFETKFAAEIAGFNGNVTQFSSAEEIAAKYFS